MYVKSSNARELVNDTKIILCNTRNGGFVKTSKLYFDYLKEVLAENNGEFVYVGTDEPVRNNMQRLFKELCKIRYYIKKNDLSREEEYTYQVVYLSLTNQCNLRCRHCVVSAEMEECSHLSTKDWKAIMQQVIDLNPSEINLTGGEPLIREDFKDLLHFLRENYKGMITLATNALLITEENIKYIKEWVNGVSVSIDGYDEASCKMVRGCGIFDKVIRSIQFLKKAGVENISASMLETSYTYNHREEFDCLCKELSVKPIFRRFSPTGRGEENGEELLPPPENSRMIEKKYLACRLCRPGKKELNICENGDVYPCAPLSGKKELKMGNVLVKKLPEIIKDESWEKGVEKLRPWNNENCNSCNVNIFCHTCINYSMGIQNHPESFIDICSYQKKHLEKLLWG